MNISEKITMLRKEKMMTQEELAEKMNVTRQAISRWESEASYPETDKLMKLATILDVDVEYLMNDQRISKKERKTLARHSNFNLAVFIINVFLVMGYHLAITLVYMKNNQYLGLIVIGLLIGFSIIAFAICRTIFVNSSEYDCIDQKTLANKTISYYMCASLVVLAFMPIMHLVDIQVTPLLTVAGIMVFKDYAMIAIFIIFFSLCQLLFVVNPLYRFIVLKRPLPKAYYLCIIECVMLITTMIAIILVPFADIIHVMIIHFIALFLILPIIFRCCRLIKTKVLGFLVINGVVLMIAFIASYSEEYISLLCALVLLIGHLIFSYVYIFKKLSDSKEIIIWYEKIIICLAISLTVVNIIYDGYYILYGLTIILVASLKGLTDYLINRRVKD